MLLRSLIKSTARQRPQHSATNTLAPSTLKFITVIVTLFPHPSRQHCAMRNSPPQPETEKLGLPTQSRTGWLVQSKENNVGHRVNHRRNMSVDVLDADPAAHKFRQRVKQKRFERSFLCVNKAQFQVQKHGNTDSTQPFCVRNFEI